MPYSTQADYLPIPPGAMGTLFDPERLKNGYVKPERRNADPGTPRPSVRRDAASTNPLPC
jgi:hypothetical protein